MSPNKITIHGVHVPMKILCIKLFNLRRTEVPEVVSSFTEEFKILTKLYLSNYSKHFLNFTNATRNNTVGFKSNNIITNLLKTFMQ